MLEDLRRIVNTVREHRGNPPVERIDRDTHLRQDLGFDSLDLAELTVRIEKDFAVDVFSDGLVFTIGEIVTKLEEADLDRS